MKNKVFGTLRWKVIIAFIMSIALSVMSIYLLLGIAELFYQITSLRNVVRYIVKNIGQLQIEIVSGVFLFIVFFFIITKKSINYIEEISIALGYISKGNLDSKIVVRSSDEFSKLAEDINLMTQRLKKSIEDERNAERTKNELITSVSHDLRTPLTSIVGYLGLIVNDRYKSEEEFHYYADIAYQKSMKLSKLIDELFEFTQLNYSSISLKLCEINLADFINQLAEEFFPILEDAGMEYRLQMPEEKVIIMADGDLLARVFDNLLTNAVRYGIDGKYIDIVLEKTTRYAVVKVINYESNIPEKDIPYIFEKFYRVEQSRSDKTGGTGLGLAIAKNIIELHNGTIKAISDNGKTFFEISLKLVEN